MHILANSVPDLNGYAIRSHDLLVSLREEEICEPVVLTSPYYPDREAMRHDTIVDGIEYIRSGLGSKIAASKKQSGFNVPKSEPFVLRALKYAFYKLKLGLKLLTRPVYKRVRMLWRFFGEKRMIKKFENEIIIHCKKANQISFMHILHSEWAFLRCEQQENFEYHLFTRFAECGRTLQLHKAVGLRNRYHTDTIEARKIN